MAVPLPDSCGATAINNHQESDQPSSDGNNHLKVHFNSMVAESSATKVKGQSLGPKAIGSYCRLGSTAGTRPGRVRTGRLGCTCPVRGGVVQLFVQHTAEPSDQSKRKSG